MEINAQKLEEFIAIYREEYGDELTPKQALEEGLRLLELVKTTNRNNENEDYGTY